MTYHRKTDLIGRFSSHHAYVRAEDNSAVSYTPRQFWQFNSRPGDISITHEPSKPGAYSVRVPGLGGPGGRHVQVSAYGTGAERCKVGSWGQVGVGGSTRQDEVIYVNCFKAGQPANSMFTLSYVGAESRDRGHWRTGAVPPRGPLAPGSRSTR